MCILMLTDQRSRNTYSYTTILIDWHKEWYHTWWKPMFPIPYIPIRVVVTPEGVAMTEYEWDEEDGKWIVREG